MYSDLKEDNIMLLVMAELTLRTAYTVGFKALSKI